jgi:hypothetical protein
VGNGTTLVAPAASEVIVTVALPLQSFFLNVQLTERVPILTLLSSIVGLSGIFAFFGALRSSLFYVSCHGREELRSQRNLHSAAEDARAAALANALRDAEAIAERVADIVMRRQGLSAAGVGADVGGGARAEGAELAGSSGARLPSDAADGGSPSGSRAAAPPSFPVRRRFAVGELLLDSARAAVIVQNPLAGSGTGLALRQAAC